jgi:uncharacterized protein YcbX
VLVKALYVYPVKACRAVALEDAALDALGLAGDRRFAFLGAEGSAVTQRDQPLLATIQPAVNATALQLDLGGLAQLTLSFDEFKLDTFVDVWGTRIAGRAAPADLASDYLGMRVTLVMLDRQAPRAFVDSKPVLVVTTGMLARLGLPEVGMERFRPNVGLEGDGEWRELRGQETVLEFAEPCSRCEVTTIDQTSGARRGPEPLRTLTERFAGNFGLYCRVARAGRLRRGETLRVS